MLGLPAATEMNKQLPKKAIYAKFQMSTAAKDKMDADISRIAIVNEISPARINIPAGETIGSFFVLLVALKKKDFDEKNIAALSKLIPQNILFVLEYEGKCRLATYRTKLLQTDWQPTDTCTVEISGLNLDTVWENIIRRLECGENEESEEWNEELSLDENLIRREKRAKLEKEIARLEKQARAERQPKKKFELVQQIKRLRGENT